MEIKYGKEPLDLRLCFLKMLKKWWILPLWVAVGAGLCAGIYFLTQIVFGPARTYVTETEYYIEYKDAITYEQQYTFYNQNTWESLCYTDIFMDAVIKGAADKGYTLTKEEVTEAVKATLLTDVRIVHVTVSTTESEKTLAISNALESAFTEFGETQREIDEIRLIKSADTAELKALDNRTGRAAILGAVIALVVTLFVMYLRAIIDTSVTIPLELTRKFGIHALVGDSKSEESVFYDSDSCKLYVKAGDKNTPVIEQKLYDLKNEGKEVKEMVLFDADTRIHDAYFGFKQKRG